MKRRPSVAAALLALGLGLASAAWPVPALARQEAPASGERAASVQIEEVGAVGITVADLDKSIAFYRDVLSFTLVDRREEWGDAVEQLTGVFGVRRLVARLTLGEESIELVQYLAPEGRPVPADSKSNDRWFQHIAIVVSDLDRAYAHLRAHRVRHASSGPQTLPDWNPNAGGISAFYFKDPDGHVLEVIHFPLGKGDPRWHRSGGELFLGIDHTAIVVADTERSLAFYRDVLGLRVAGGSENFGIEQERLNGVFGARLRITTLRAAKGPGIELLEYLAPTDGRDYPADARANDLIHWTTTLHMGASADVPAALRQSRARLVSSGDVGAEGVGVATGRALQTRDPDGHALQFVWPAGATEEPGAEAGAGTPPR